jgi:hypothetical protein
MESLAKAKWNSSIEYPENGWHICNICGEITNEIDRCLYCKAYVCWDCSNEAIDNDEWDGCHYCSYEHYRLYMEKEYNIEYNPQEEYEELACNRLDQILECFDKHQLIHIILYINESINNHSINDKMKLEYKNMTEQELLNKIKSEHSGDIYETITTLYKDEVDFCLDNILDGEAYINSLDPNDPADEWFFED